METKYLTKGIMWLLSCIVGVLLGVMIGRFIFINERGHGPNSKNIVGKVFRTPDGEYWRFVPEITVCPLDTSFFPSRLDGKTED